MMWGNWSRSFDEYFVVWYDHVIWEVLVTVIREYITDSNCLFCISSPLFVFLVSSRLGECNDF